MAQEITRISSTPSYLLTCRHCTRREKQKTNALFDLSMSYQKMTLTESGTTERSTERRKDSPSERYWLIFSITKPIIRHMRPSPHLVSLSQNHLIYSLCSARSGSSVCFGRLTTACRGRRSPLSALLGVLAAPLMLGVRWPN